MTIGAVDAETCFNTKAFSAELIGGARYISAVIHHAFFRDTLRIVGTAGVATWVGRAVTEDADISVGAFDASAWVIALAGVRLAR